MNIQWYPGHMAKTRKMLAENLRLVDVVIELIDARIPKSSHNPDIKEIIRNCPSITALNKADLADEKISHEWSSWYNSNGHTGIFVDSIKGKGMNELKARIRELMKEKLDRDKLKGRLFTPIRTMVVGIPNVGKSSFINRIAGRASAVTGDKPGVTRGKQWIRINEDIELLDTPGILQRKIEDSGAALNLAFTGAIKDETYDTVEAAALLMEKLFAVYPDFVKARYKLEVPENTNGEELLEKAGKNRGCIISGGMVDLYRISAIVLDEFRGGKIGRITLERP